MSGVVAKAELLAPAGDAECMKAAVLNGADAVYFGLEDFNARRRAANFTLADLPATMDYLHRHNVRGYVAFNTLVFTDELERAADFVRGVIEAGADALIVQDLGIMRLIRAMSPTFPIHASTQTTQTHADGMAVLEKLGVSRVILARELSIAEMYNISQQTPLELEVFVHGALCVSYSGQCLASESLWGRSGNRGVCAQACRLPYQLMVDGKVQRAEGGEFLLSPHDLAAYDRLPELLQAGATAFKIEGRLKGPEYVAAITGLYREALDAAIAGQPFAPSPARAEELAQSFSRGFTSGYLDGNQHQQLIGAESPKSRGVRIGSVIESNRRGVVVQLEDDAVESVKPGDGLVFHDGAAEENEQGGRIYSVEPWPSKSTAKATTRNGNCRLLTFGRDNLDPSKVPVGAGVLKSDDPAVRRRIQATYARDRVVQPVPVAARVTALPDGRLELTLSDERGSEATVCSAETLPIAERHPTTPTLLAEQLARLGDTPFELDGVELYAADKTVESIPLLAPKSVLNDLRRRAVQTLTEARARAARHPLESGNVLGRLRFELAALPPLPGERTVTVHVLTRDLEQHAAVNELAASPVGAAIGTIYGDFSTLGQYAEAARIAAQYDRRFAVVTPQVLKPGEERLVNDILRTEPGCVLVRNLAALAAVRRQLPDADLVGDFSLNVTNELSAAVLNRAGLTRITPGYDLNLSQLSALARALPGMEFETVVHAHLPMFHTAHCLAASKLSGAGDCRQCSHPCHQQRLHLRDRNGEEHLVRTDAAGRSTVFNSRAQTMAACRRTPIITSWRHWRVELLDETPADAQALLGLYLRWAGGDEKAATDLRRWRPSYVSGAFEHV